jgi:hypothetical protein
MLIAKDHRQHKREVAAPSTDDPQTFQGIGDLAKAVTKRAILRGYAHGILSVETTQELIDALDLRRA